MSTIAEKLTLLQNTKEDIKSAIAEKGQVISDATPFSEYGDKIRAIKTGGDYLPITGGTLRGDLNVDGNGIYNVPFISVYPQDNIEPLCFGSTPIDSGHIQFVCTDQISGYAPILIGNPSVDEHAATKKYVDSISLSSSWKQIMSHSSSSGAIFENILSPNYITIVLISNSTGSATVPFQYHTLPGFNVYAGTHSYKFDYNGSSLVIYPQSPTTSTNFFVLNSYLYNNLL